MSSLIVLSLAKIAFVVGLLFGFAPLLVWAERRQSAMIQDRIGPVRAGFHVGGRKVTLAGLLHPLADAIKMLWKEDFVPPGGDRFLHGLAPVMTVVPVFLSFSVIPFGGMLHLDAMGSILGHDATGALCTLGADGVGGRVCDGPVPGPATALQVASLSVGILFAFAASGAGVLGSAIAGCASNSKYSLLGGLRAAAQIVSYEVVLGLTLVGCFLIYGSLRLEEMVAWQQAHVWGIAVQPLAFVLYLVAATAENKRVPFDVVEGESEIVGGYFTEYSGMKFGMFFMSEFMEVVVLAALAVTLFFGGWHAPGIDTSGLNVLGSRLYLPHGIVVALQVATFVGKLVIMMWFQLMLRWSLPRFRYDQIMTLCWKGILPLALANVALTALGVLILGN